VPEWREEERGQRRPLKRGGLLYRNFSKKIKTIIRDAFMEKKKKKVGGGTKRVNVPIDNAGLNQMFRYG